MEGDNQQLTDSHAGRDEEPAPRRNAFMQLMAALAQRSTIASVAGNVLEWYDFAVFGAFAAEIGELFFPSADPVASVMQAFGVFGAAFLMRPLGGMFFGHIGDKMGRKTALMWSVLIMAVSSVVIGILPTYDTWGNAAPALLTVVRLLQGFSVGGEFVGSILFVTESAPHDQRGMYGSLSMASAVMGTVLGTLTGAIIRSILSHEAVLSYGWRLPFLAGCVVALVALWMRKSVEESAEFLAVKAAQEGAVRANPIVTAVREQWRAILLVAGATMSISTSVWLTVAWLPTFASVLAESPTPGGFWVATLCLLLQIFLMPIFGRLSDLYGRDKALYGGNALFALTAAPAIAVIALGMTGPSTVAFAAVSVAVACLAGCLPTWMVETFPPDTRFSGMAIGYNITQAICGGSISFVATAIIRAVPHAPYLVGVYTACLCPISIASVYGASRILSRRLPRGAMPLSSMDLGELTADTRNQF